MSGNYRDPWLHAMRNESRVADKVEDKWFTGSETRLPRWMPLKHNDIGFRACVEGVRVQVPVTRGGDIGLETRLMALGLVRLGEEVGLRSASKYRGGRRSGRYRGSRSDRCAADSRACRSVRPLAPRHG